MRGMELKANSCTSTFEHALRPVGSSLLHEAFEFEDNAVACRKIHNCLLLEEDHVGLELRNFMRLGIHK